MTDRLNLERQLLGAMLVNNYAYNYVFDWLAPQYFRGNLHAQIFEAICALIAAGVDATPVTVKACFPLNTMVAPDVPIARYLATLAAAAIPIADVTSHAIRLVALRPP